MLEKVTKASQDISSKSKIADIFIAAIDSMKVYTQFVNNFSASLNMIETERAKSKAFNQFLMSNEDTQIPLEALITKPLNRIPSFRRELSIILAATPRNGPEYMKLAQANEKLSDLQEYLNQSKSQSDDRSKVFSIESKIVGREYLLNEPHRKFLQEGQINYLGPDKKIKDYYAFLFNDIIVITKKIPQKQQYRYKCSYSLQYGSVTSCDGLQIEFKSPSHKDTLTLYASNQDMKKQWIDGLQKALDHMEKTKVFRVTIDDLLEREPEGVEIPSVITNLISHIEKYSLETPGIFRLSGSSTTINSIISRLDRGIEVDFTELDNNVVTGLLKQFLRTLAEPIFPFSKFDQLLECYDNENPIEPLKNLINELPTPNFLILKRLTQLLVKVAKFSDINKMTTSNLAIVIGPNLAREEVPSPFGEINLTTKVSPLVQIIIEKYDEIFPKDPPPRFSKAVPRTATIIGPSKSVSTSGMLGSRRNLSSSDSQRAKPAPRPPPRRSTVIQSANIPIDRSAYPNQNPNPNPKQSDRPLNRSVPPKPHGPPRGGPRPPGGVRLPLHKVPPTPQEPPPPPIDVTPEETPENNNSVDDETAENPVAEICQRCQAEISEEFIELCEKFYHPECFLCYMCSSELNNGYFKQGGNPVCKDCRRKSRAARS